jgi:surface polysaccharide O-acyltransferase-like enzyme
MFNMADGFLVSAEVSQSPIQSLARALTDYGLESFVVLLKAIVLCLFDRAVEHTQVESWCLMIRETV